MWQMRYIQHSEIDFLKWDECIDASPNGLLYAYSWFLTTMSPGWDALVLNDYEAVMPLAQRKKWGIRYLYQPAFCAELGVFSRAEISSSLVNVFLNNIPAHFRFVDVCLNRSNHLPIEGYSFDARNNYLLSLNADYKTIAGNYSLNHKRNIRKAVNTGFRWSKDVSIEKAVEIAKHTLKNITDLPEDDWQNFAAVFRKAQSKHSGICAGVMNEDGELLSVAVFIHAHGLWHYLLAGSTEKGRKSGAAHFLIDQFIQQHAGSKNSLDFEGSDIASVAFFYRGFGASGIHYPSLRLNRLPLLIRWMK